MKANQSYSVILETRNRTTGLLQNADSTPTCQVYKNGSIDASFSLTITNITTGIYKATGNIPSSYITGDIIYILCSATVNGESDTAIIDNFEIQNVNVDDIDNDISSIKSQTDKLTFNGNNSVRSDIFDISNSGLNTAISRIDDTVSSRAPASTALSNVVWTNDRASRLDNLDTTISSRAPASTALSNVVWTDARASKLDNLDVAISSRGSQADVTAIKSKTDNLQFNANNFVKSDVSSVSDNGLNMAISRIDDTVTSRAPASTALSNMIWTDARASKLDNLDTTISSRAPASTALSNATWTDERAAKLDNLDATVSSRGSQADLLAVKSKTDNLQFDANNFIKSNVMDVSDTELNTAISNMDIAVSSRASQSTADAIKAKTDYLNFDASSNVKANVADVSDPELSGAISTISANLDTTISSRSDQNTAVAIKNKTDQLYFDPSSNVKANIADVSDIELNNAISNIDVAVSTRASASTALSNTVWTDVRAAKLDNLDIAVSSRASQVDLLAIKSQTDKLQFDINSFVKSDIMDITDVELNTAISNIDTTISSRASQTTIDSIKEKTDQLNFDINSNIKANITDISDQELGNAIQNMDIAVSTRAPVSTALSNQIWTNDRASKLDNLDTIISSRADQITVNNIKTKTDQLTFSGSNVMSELSSNSIENINVYLSNIHGSGSWDSMHYLNGFSLQTIIKDNNDNAISGVLITIRNSSGTKILQTLSNIDGVNISYLPSGNYNIYFFKQGYEITNPYILSLDSDKIINITADVQQIPEPTETNICRIYDYLYDADSLTPHSQEPIYYCYITKLPYSKDGKLHISDKIKATYNSSTGLIYFDIVKGATVKIFIDKFYPEKTIIVPDETTKRLAQCKAL